MFNFLRKFARPQATGPRPALPPGQRAYAVGDIHGRADLLAALIDAVEDDCARRDAITPMETTIILLGDLVDRGPDSRGVLEMARAWQQRRTVRILVGNHEEMMLQAMERIEVLRHFLRHGGRETILSFGVDADAYTHASYEDVMAMMHDFIPNTLVDFIRGFEDCITIGDYTFVHAGIRPGVPMEQQSIDDLRWIREPFLSSDEHHGNVIVHGHTITDNAVIRPNRLGIDTGAYQSGRLTALGLQGEERWLIEASMSEDRPQIAVEALT